MSTITLNKTLARSTALRTLSENGGFSTTGSLDDQTVYVFDLASDNSHPFVKTLLFIKNTMSTDDEALEAALNALNISPMVQLDLSDRRLMLMQKRSEEGRDLFEPETPSKLVALEQRGFDIIAAVYDYATMMMNANGPYEELAAGVKALADSQTTPRNISKAINDLLTRTGSR